VLIVRIDISVFGGPMLLGVVGLVASLLVLVLINNE